MSQQRSTSDDLHLYSYWVMKMKLFDNEKSQRDTFDPDERLELDSEHIHKKSTKDIWDKIAAVAPIVSGMLIFVMGGWFTYTYNQQQLHLQEIQTIEKFIPHLMGNDQSKRAAILAISSLTNAELATKFAQIFSSPGTVSALQSLAENGSQKDKNIATDALARALENLAARESRLNEIETAFHKAATESTNNSAHPAKSESPLDQLEEAQKLERLAITLRERGHLGAAESLLKQAVNIRLRTTGDSRDVVNTLKKLSDVQSAQGNSVEAEETNKKVTTLENKLNSQPVAPPPAAKPADETPKVEKPAAQAVEAIEKPSAAVETKTDLETN